MLHLISLPRNKACRNRLLAKQSESSYICEQQTRNYFDKVGPGAGVPALVPVLDHAFAASLNEPPVEPFMPMQQGVVPIRSGDVDQTPGFGAVSFRKWLYTVPYCGGRDGQEALSSSPFV
jgi:hypothetical protein